MTTTLDQNARTCCASLNILLGHVKSVEQLHDVESAIRDYEHELGRKLPGYRERVREMREMDFSQGH